MEDIRIIHTREAQINAVDLETFRPYLQDVSDEIRNAFYAKCGREHFRLLAYISSLTHNATIINIHTNGGYEALALSHNETNTVYSFNTPDELVNSNVRERRNIQFIPDDLLKSSVREKWRKTILQSAFIFVDIEPHEGYQEYILYKYLSEIGYGGFVIYNKMWYYRSMRNQFWYRIPDNYRYDLTEVGHLYGTGIVNFNDSIAFDKRDNSNWTLVTAYFNLPECPDTTPEFCASGDKPYYFSHALSTLSLPYNLVIYCDAESYPRIARMRPLWFANKTRYVLRNFDELRFIKYGEPMARCFRDYREKIAENRRTHPYFFDNSNTPVYYTFCMAKYAFLKETITENPFNSTHFAWIHFCVEKLGFQNLIRLDEALAVKRDKFSTCYIDYVPESLVNDTPQYFQYGRCSMCSGFFTGNAKYMYKVCDLVENKFLEYLQQGYGHADEQLFSSVYFENPRLFEHYYGDYLQMITNYTHIYEAPEPPIYNFITNSYNNGDYVKCLEGCRFVQRSIELGKCNLRADHAGQLTYFIDAATQKLNDRKNNSTN